MTDRTRVLPAMTGVHCDDNFARFFTGIVREVDGAMRRGLSLAQMKQTIRLERYRDWAHYETLREPNIEAAYRNLRIYK